MSWADAFRRIPVLAGLVLALSACQPLYAPSLLGEGASTKLKDIEIAPVPGRFGHYLRTNLQFAFGGGALPRAPQYRLTVVATPRNRIAVVNRQLTSAESASVLVVATYTLVRIADGEPVLTGAVSGSASYERTDQRFGALRAAQDAEERAAQLISDQIRTRVASAIAAGMT
jgi:LPS-assembly lipoprotein